MSDINRHGHVVGVSGELTTNAFTGVQATFLASGTSTAQALPRVSGVAGSSRAEGMAAKARPAGVASGPAQGCSVPLTFA